MFFDSLYDERTNIDNYISLELRNVDEIPLSPSLNYGLGTKYNGRNQVDTCGL